MKRAEIELAGVALALLLTAATAIGQQVGQQTGQQEIPPALSTPTSPASCSKSLLTNFQVIHNGPDGEIVRESPVWRSLNDSAFFFQAGMTIDADGSPNAYNAENTGLDDLSNAGEPGHWQGVVMDEKGDPFVQGPDDPFPGFYVSCTALGDRTKRGTDPTRYVDASKIPYVVLPGNLAREAGARLGDFAVVLNSRNGKYSYAIFADIGTFGEGSIALADNLGIWSDARNGGRRDGLLYLVFPGSGNGQPRPIEEIKAETDKLFQAWGGAQQITTCATN